jgi:hypothetical protein
MMLGDLITLQQLDFPVKVVVFNKIPELRRARD